VSVAFGFKNSADFSGVTTFNFSKGANTINSGDFIIVSAYLHPASGDPGSALPSGFTTIVDAYDSGSTGSRYLIAWKEAGGAETGSYAVPTLASACDGTWSMVTYTGGQASPIDVASGAIVNTAALTCPSLSPVAATDTYVGICVAANSGGAFVPPSGLTKRQDTVNDDARSQEIIVADKVLSASGATGTFVGTQTNSFAAAMAALTIIPAIGGGGGSASRLTLMGVG
jgi:hypothetical protein